MQRGRDCGETPRTFNRHVTFRVYLLHPEVRSMSKAFRMYLLHPDDDLSCSGSARVRKVAPFRIRLWYSNSVPNESVHRSPHEQHMRMILKPSSFKLMVGIRVRTPKMAALWRGVKNTSTRASMLLCGVMPWRRRARAVGGATCAVEETYTAE
jgi:hypothetical protein